MANSSGVITSARIIEIHTGNIINCDIIKPNILRSPKEEVNGNLVLYFVPVLQVLNRTKFFRESPLQVIRIAYVCFISSLPLGSFLGLIIIITTFCAILF